MSDQWKYTLKVVVAVLLCGIIVVAGINIYKQVFNKNVVPVSFTVSDMEHELAIIKIDLETYHKLSDMTINKIITSMRKTSLKYELPVGLLHCINRVESEYQFNIVHPTVTVLIGKQKLVTNAVGTSGILWCYWGEQLKKENIAQMETDLFYPDVSIEAEGYILRWLINDELSNVKKDSLKNERITKLNILAHVVKRYYGAYSEQYLSKMETVTSDLWMRRIAEDLTSEKDTLPNHVVLNKETIK